ncbi:MAG TPA: Do family serine endopeptidase [Thermoanaerobaculaceae bacterium]|nr:Do family serine endopeptidase [Thermoanaerobaculaceae bacterium]HPS78935.1 Do family serine endopeptidase [Thermoanaerobaculaceae bacterium]
MYARSLRKLIPLGTVAVGGVVLGLVLAGGLAVTPQGRAESAAPAAVAAPAPVPPAGYPDFASLADRVLPSVISVYTEEVMKPGERGRNRNQMDPFEFFFGLPPQGQPDRGRTPRNLGAGSAFFISADGLAMTNNHVIEGADKIKVRLTDETELDAKVIGRDPATDLALLKVEGKKSFAWLPLGDSNSLRVGEWVMAAGNPRRMSHTITVGVVSAKGRTIGLTADASFENFIQTDAAINLGNSGGPLVNLRGEVVGINSAIDAAGQNIGFAVPINTAKGILDQLKKGKVVRGYMGVDIRNIDDETREAFSLSGRNGAFVARVREDGPAEKAGLQKGDVVVSVNSKPVKETRDVIDTVSAMAPGSKVEIEVVRDGTPKTLTVTLGERPGAEADAESAEETRETTPAGKLGMQVQELTPQVRRTFSIAPEIGGVVITGVTDLSPADDKGLREGDVILQVNGNDVNSVAAFRKALGTPKSGQLVRLYVFRPRLEQQDFVFLRVP